MRAALLALGALVVMSLASCSTEIDDPTPTDQIQQEVGGKSCYSTAECPGDLRCTTEVGDCRTPPWCGHGRFACPAVCAGVCTHLDTCGGVTCIEGEVCCNESCGICTLPENSCIQIICGSEEVLPG